MLFTYTYKRPKEPKQLVDLLLFFGSYIQTVNSEAWNGYEAGRVFVEQVTATYDELTLKTIISHDDIGKFPRADLNKLTEILKVKL